MTLTLLCEIMKCWAAQSCNYRNKIKCMFTACNSSCGKGMFSHVCVKNSVHRGRVCIPACNGQRGCTHPCWADTPSGRPPHEMATESGGTHPTGMHSCYCPQWSWGKVIFSEACVKNSVHGGHAWLLGGCAWLPGCMHGCGGDVHGCGGMCGCWGVGGHVWGVCGCGGMCGCQGACMVAGGHAWLWGACMVAGGCAWLRGWDVWLPEGGACVGYDEIRTVSGR